MPIELDSRRELFVDHYLIERLDGLRLALHSPREEEVVLRFDQPWEGVFSCAAAVIKHGTEFRLYYRAMPAVTDGSDAESTCVALSDDGIHWTRPSLGLFELAGSKENNAVIAHQPPFSHNFMPFLDTRPGAEPEERYKAIAGIHPNGIFAFASPDGMRWRKLQPEPVLTSEAFAFDSHNVAFWSEMEGTYLCYFRTWKDGVRWVSRAASEDFVHWGPTEEMSFVHEAAPAPIEHIYTNATQPYFRAPHMYVALPRRFMAGRRVLSREEADSLNVHGSQRADCSDAVFMTSRGSSRYDRTFLEAFIRPGPERGNWSSRAGTIACGVVQTGPREMSVYRNEQYGQPTVRQRRYSLRLDGFCSVRAAYCAGELLTKPFTFAGSRLMLNFETAAAGGIRVEVQDEHGQPLPGYRLDDSVELIGDEIDRAVAWKRGEDLSAIAGRPVRLRFVMREADLYSMTLET